MKQTWRWFGPKDTVSIDDMLQAGVEGVVTALHHIPNGEVWTKEEIEKRQVELSHMQDGAPSNLKWDVVESLVVSEDIKKQSGDYKIHFENYKTSLENLAQAGINIVCYNFMPILDWTRTDLAYRLKNGATCMRFDLVDFATFELHLLKREGAHLDYCPEIKDKANARFKTLSDVRVKEICDNIVTGFPGANQTLDMDGVKQLLSQYSQINEEKLRQHLTDFLSEIIPTAERLGIKMCCHPDDPPFPLLGLPRIMSTNEDYQRLVDSVKSPANGITLCSGSLGARADNDLVELVKQLGSHIHFIHLRNVQIEEDQFPASFHEAEHLGGSTDMVLLIKAILDEEQLRQKQRRSDFEIPMRPDHGQNILDDLEKPSQPGYPAIGRLKGLAELRGIMTALNHSQISG